MIERGSNFYNLLAFGFGGLTSKSFQQFVDKFNDKYNVLNIEGFERDRVQLDYTYEQLLVENTISTIPQWVDESSEALSKGFGEFKIGSNKIATQKHAYSIDKKVIRERLIALQKFGEAALNNETRDALMDVLFESVDKLLEGNYNAWTYERMQAVSKGSLTVNSTNNSRGIKGYTFDFGIPAANKESLSGNDRFWTSSTHTTANEGSTSDPIAYLRTKTRDIRKAGIARFHMEISKNLFDDLLTHSKVLASIGFSLYPQSASADAAASVARNLSDEALTDAFGRLIGCPVKTQDSYVAIDKLDTTTKTIKESILEGFDPLNIAFVPDGIIGSIKAVQPIALGGPNSVEAFFDGGRMLLSQTFNEREKTCFIESEMATLAVPSMPTKMFIYTVTA